MAVAKRPCAARVALTDRDALSRATWIEPESVGGARRKRECPATAATSLLPRARQDIELLDVMLLEKAVCELDHCPERAGIPLRGILQLLGAPAGSHMHVQPRDFVAGERSA
jgi:hypothetical protein